MIHIKRSTDAKFYYVAVGDNGEVLNQSETENKKQSVWKGIAATAKAYNSKGHVKVTDCTLKKPITYRLWLDKLDKQKL